MTDPARRLPPESDTPDPEDKLESPEDEDQFEVDEDAVIGHRMRDAASKVAKGAGNVVKRALQSREHVLMVRVNDETLKRISDLKDAGLFRSRSEAAAYLIAEGIESRAELFQRIEEKIKQIQEIKDELRALADGEEVDDHGDDEE